MNSGKREADVSNRLPGSGASSFNLLAKVFTHWEGGGAVIILQIKEAFD